MENIFIPLRITDSRYKMKKKVLIVQPLIPHYRESFFDGLAEQYELLVLYSRDDKSFKICNKKYARKVKSLLSHKIEYFHILNDLIKFKPDVVITYGEVKQLTNTLLFLLKKILKFKLLIWSTGFKSKQLSIIDKIRLFQMKRSDGVIFYTKKCKSDAQMLKIHKSTYLNNTLEIDKIHKLQINCKKDKKELKKEYCINTSINGIFISRFTPEKAPNLLLEIMIKIHNKNPNIGFVIIGDGDYKPDFTAYDFIYDFGRVYGDVKKAELFKLADFAIMPRWVGLSVVEVFANQLPMFTLTSNLKNIEHSVEINYVKNNYNGYIANSENELINTIANMPLTEFERMGINASNYVQNNLAMDKMVNNMTNYINSFNK